MKIAFVVHQFFPRHYTGVERDTLNLVHQFRLLGHDSVVVTPTTAAGGSDEYVFEGARVRTVETATVGWNPATSSGSEDELARLFDEEHVDLVHVAHAMRTPQVFSVASRLGLATVAHLHDYYYLCAQVVLVRANGQLCSTAAGGDACADYCRVPRAHDRLEWAREALSLAAGAVSPSRFLISLLQHEGFVARSWHHIPCGVDYAHFEGRFPAPNGAELRFGLMGTLLPHKGPQLAVEAVRLRPDLPVRLLLYGESFDQRSFDQELRARAGRDPRIEFKGAYRHQELHAILETLDAVVVPSLWYENYPITAAVAAAAGVPIIGSALGGIEEMVEDLACGFTFPFGDAESLADLFERLCSDRSLLVERRGQMRFPPSVEDEAVAMESVYADALTA